MKVELISELTSSFLRSHSLTVTHPLPSPFALRSSPSSAMSVVIDYALLSDPALTSSLVDAFNANLASAPRPSFLGPISLNSFDFGTEPPDVEVVGLRDVYKDFLDAEEEEEDDDNDEGHGGEGGGDSWTDGASAREGHDGGGGGWSRTGTDDDPLQHPNRRDDHSQHHTGLNIRGLASPPPSMGPLPPFHGRPGFDFGSPLHHGSPFTSRVGLGSGLHSPIPTPYLSRNPSFSSLPPGAGPSPTPSTGSPPPPRGPDREGNSRRPSPNQQYPSTSSKPAHDDEDASPSGPPSLQLHLHIHHPSNIRISLSTTLLINHPSPSFMSLPLTLTITRLELDFHLVIAFEAASASNSAPAPNPSPSHSSRQQPPSRGTRRRAPGNRVHISILDELDPYGPPTPSNPDSSPPSGVNGFGQDGKPAPIGQRIIPRMEIESGIGQEGEHVLRNVQKVERFVLELLRKTVVDELVFPNFQTLVV